MEIEKLIEKLKNKECVWVINVDENAPIMTTIKKITITEASFEPNMILVKLSNDYLRFSRDIFENVESACEYRKSFWNLS